MVNMCQKKCHWFWISVILFLFFPPSMPYAFFFTIGILKIHITFDFGDHFHGFFSFYIPQRLLEDEGFVLKWMSIVFVLRCNQHSNTRRGSTICVWIEKLLQQNSSKKNKYSVVMMCCDVWYLHPDWFPC